MNIKKGMGGNEIFVLDDAGRKAECVITKLVDMVYLKRERS